MAGNRQRMAEADMEAQMDAEALKRVSAMNKDKKRFQRAQKKIQSEQQQADQASEMVSGLRRKG